MTAEQIRTSLQQARRIRFVVSQLRGNYPGLTRTPWGILCFLIYSDLLFFPSMGTRTGAYVYMGVTLLVFTACGLLSIGFQRYYARRFGRILPGTASGSERPVLSLGWFLTAAGAIGGFLLLSLSLGARYHTLGILLAFFYLFTWWVSDGVRVHRAVFAVFTAAASLLPLTGMIDHPFASTLVRDLLELECVLGGICDHVLLVRSFRELAAGSHEHAVPRAC